jgi:hypothetical protein
MCGAVRQFWKLSALLVAVVAAAAAQTAILQIRVVEGEGAVHSPGSRTGRAVTVEVADDSGKPVPGAAVSFHLPEDGPGGSFVNGLRTDVAITDAHGRATARGFLPNRLPGRFQLRILASKQQARAGTVSFQYIGESGAGTVSAAKSNKKWVALAAAAAGGVLAGAMAARGSGGKAIAPTPPATTGPAPVVPTIGTPTISVGKP